MFSGASGGPRASHVSRSSAQHFSLPLPSHQQYALYVTTRFPESSEPSSGSTQNTRSFILSMGICILQPYSATQPTVRDGCNTPLAQSRLFPNQATYRACTFSSLKYSKDMISFNGERYLESESTISASSCPSSFQPI